MKFYGNGVVWDSNKNKALCKFVKGEYETKNAYEIEYLLSKGYDNDGVQEETKEEEVATTQEEPKKETKVNTSKRKR